MHRKILIKTYPQMVLLKMCKSEAEIYLITVIYSFPLVTRRFFFQITHDANIALCLALVNPTGRNWFRKSQLTSKVAIVLCKPYAKTKVGKSWTCMMFIDS
jgi:hypothetical protein